MIGTIAKSLRLPALSFLTTAALLAGPALADGTPTRGRVKGPEPTPQARPCALSANVALTTDYVFRGFSQTREGAAVQGGFDATCGIFYAGVWASSLDWGGAASVEMDWYAGIKPKTGPIAWDLGVIYYSYPNSFDLVPGRNNEYVELKVGASGEIWKDGTLGATVFYSPDYQYETGSTWTIEGSFSQVLPRFGMFSPTFSALIGYQTNDGSGAAGAVYANNFGNGNDNYTYWNIGLNLGFLEKWSLDLRYWDTNHNDSAFCDAGLFQCDARFVATLKFTY